MKQPLPTTMPITVVSEIKKRHFTNTGAYSPLEQTGTPVYIFVTFSNTLSLHVVVRKIYKDINDH